MKERINKILLVAIMMFAAMSPVGAIDGADANIKYTVEAILPDNQVDESVTYYHLLVNETHQQEIKVKVKNLKSEPITVIGSANNAKTNSNGVIDYSSNKSLGNATTKKPDFESLVKAKTDKVTLKGYEEKEFLFEVDLKDTKFEGIILGGFQFELEEQVSLESGIGQTYSYSISAVLSQNDSLLKSSKSLEMNGITPIVKDGYKYLNVEFENDVPAILSNLSIDAKIYDEKGIEVIYEKQQDQMEMAPHTLMTYLIDTGKKDLASGTYHYVIEASSFKENWRWESQFVIEDEEANEVNSLSLNTVEIPQVLKYGFLVLLLLTIINTFLLVKEGTKKEDKR